MIRIATWGRGRPMVSVAEPPTLNLDEGTAIGAASGRDAARAELT